MVDKAQLQAYIQTLPPKEQAEFTKLPEKEQISIMNRELFFSKAKVDLGSSVWQNNPSPSDNTRVERFQPERVTELNVQMTKKEQEEGFKKYVAQQRAEARLTPEQKQLRQTVIKDRQQNLTYAQTNFDGQMKKDGWAADAADGISALWNNNLWNATGNRATFVKEDLAQYQKNTKILQQAIKDGTYEYKFKQIYGVDYDEKNVKAFYQTEKQFQNIAQSVQTAAVVDDKFAEIFETESENFGLFRDRNEVLHSPTGTFNRKTPKEFVLAQAEKTVTDMVGGEEAIKQIAKQSNVDLSKLNQEQQYKFYMQIAHKISDASHQSAKEALDGKTMDDYMKQYNTARARAFGTKNNIEERVQKYNTSQEVGAAAVKAATKTVVVVGGSIAIVASGGTATPLVVAGLTTASSIGVEVSDRATNGIDGDLSAADWQKITKNGLVDGAFAYGGSYIGKGISALANPTSQVGQTAWKMTSNGLSSAAEGSLKDGLKGGWDNISVEAFAVRAAVASVLGNVKVFTNNDALLKGIKITQSVTTDATLKQVKISLQESASKTPEAKQVAAWVEQHPEEFEQIVIEQINK